MDGYGETTVMVSSGGIWPTSTCSSVGCIDALQPGRRGGEERTAQMSHSIFATGRPNLNYLD